MERNSCRNACGRRTAAACGRAGSGDTRDDAYLRHALLFWGDVDGQDGCHDWSQSREDWDREIGTRKNGAGRVDTETHQFDRRSDVLAHDQIHFRQQKQYLAQAIWARQSLSVTARNEGIPR